MSRHLKDPCLQAYNHGPPRLLLLLLILFVLIGGLFAGFWFATRQVPVLITNGGRHSQSVPTR